MLRLSRRCIRFGLTAAALTLGLSLPVAADAQRRDVRQGPLNERGDPAFSGLKRRSGFTLFGLGDEAQSGIRSPSKHSYGGTNGGVIDFNGGYSHDPGTHPIAGTHYSNFISSFSILWGVPPSVRDTIVARAGAAGAGLALAVGSNGWSVRSNESSAGSDNLLAIDGALGTLHSGEPNTADGSCLDHRVDFITVGTPLMAGSDCPVTWGSPGWLGRRPVSLDAYLAEARANPTTFGFDFWRIKDPATGELLGEADPSGKLGRKFGSFQTYGVFSDYTKDDICGTATSRGYGKVIRPAPGGSDCPNADPVKPGYPLGLEVRVDNFVYGIPALQDIAYYQITVTNKSQDLYGVGIDYDSLYLGFTMGHFGNFQENQIYFRPELSAVLSTATCVHQSPSCNGGRTAAEMTQARFVGRGTPWQSGTTAVIMLKSPIGDLRNKLFTRAGSPFNGLPGIPATILDDTITMQHGHQCGFRACARTTFATSASLGDHMQRQFGMLSSTERNVLGTRLPSDPTLSANNSQVLWHTFRSFDNPAAPPLGSGPADFPQRGGFNRWVPGATGSVGKWDWNNDGLQDTLFYDTCSSKANPTDLRTACVGLFSDTMPGGFINAYGNVAATMAVGPIKFKAGDTTSFVMAMTAACCGAAESDSAATMVKVNAAIDHYLNFYLGPEPLPVDTIIAVEVIGGDQSQSQVTLRFTQTAETAPDPFLLDQAAKTASAAPSTVTGKLVRLNPFLADSLAVIANPFGTPVGTGLTAIGNFVATYIFKSCDGGNTFTTRADCEPSPATGGPFAALGWLPYASFPVDAASGTIANTFTDPNVQGGSTYIYVLVSATRGAAFNLITGDLDSTGTGPNQTFFCRSNCSVQRLEFAPQLFNTLSTSGPQVATVYVPLSLQAGGQMPIVTIQPSSPVPSDRLIITTASNRPVPGTYNVVFFDSVLVRVVDSLDVDGKVRQATRTKVIGYRGTTVDSTLTSSALGGIGLGGASSVRSTTVVPVTGGQLRTTVYVFKPGLVAVLSRGGEAILVTKNLNPDATPESFFSSTAFPGFTIGFASATARAFNTARGEVFVGPDEKTVAPLVTPFIRRSGSTAIAAAGQGGLYTFTWVGLPFGPQEPFRLDLANPDATQAAITASLNARQVGSTGLTTAEVATLLGTTAANLVPVKVPFTITNESFGARQVSVAMLKRSRDSIRVGNQADTLTVAIPSDAWVPGDRLILLEDTGSGLKVTFNPYILECAAGQTSAPAGASCNPLALNTPGATGFITTPIGTKQSVLYNPALTNAQQFTFVVPPPRSGQALAAACGDSTSATAGDPDLCAEIKQSIKDVKVVPNPYVVFTQFNVGSGLVRPLMFTHVPAQGTVRIYTASGQFVQQITWTPELLNETGDLVWDLRTRESNLIAAGLYLFIITGKDAGGRNLGTHMGKFVVIR